MEHLEVHEAEVLLELVAPEGGGDEAEPGHHVQVVVRGAVPQEGDLARVR